MTSVSTFFFLLLLLLLIALLLPLGVNSSQSRSRSQSQSRSILDPFDPSAYDIHMTSEERAWRAANEPGGEISYCCCYCGRETDEHPNPASSSSNDVGVPSGEEWLYKPLRVQPRPEVGDYVDRLARREKKLRQKRKVRKAKLKRKSKKARFHKDEPYGDVPSGVADFILYRTVRTYCDNEYCIDQSSVCRRNHLWTGWAGPLTSAGVEPPVATVRAQCSKLYQREMEVLEDFNRILDQDATQHRQQQQSQYSQRGG